MRIVQYIVYPSQDLTFVIDRVEPQSPARVELTDLLENDLAASLASDFIATETQGPVEKLPGKNGFFRLIIDSKC